MGLFTAIGTALAPAEFLSSTPPRGPVSKILQKFHVLPERYSLSCLGLAELSSKDPGGRSQ